MARSRTGPARRDFHDVMNAAVRADLTTEDLPGSAPVIRGIRGKPGDPASILPHGSTRRPETGPELRKRATPKCQEGPQNAPGTFRPKPRPSNLGEMPPDGAQRPQNGLRGRKRSTGSSRAGKGAKTAVMERTARCHIPSNSHEEPVHSPLRRRNPRLPGGALQPVVG